MPAFPTVLSMHPGQPIAIATFLELFEAAGRTGRDIALQVHATCLTLSFRYTPHH